MKIPHKRILYSGVTLIFLATGIANVANYLYTLIVGRLLGPSSYGLLSVIISLISIMSVPTMALNTVCAKFAAQFKAQNTPEESWILMQRLIRRILQSGAIGIVLLIFLSEWLTEQLNLPSPIYLWWLLILLISSFLLVVPTSLVQGLQLFKSLAIAIILGGVIKLTLGVSFVYFSGGVSGALLAILLSVTISFVYAVSILKKRRSEKVSSSLSRADLLKFATPTLLTHLGLTIINYQDLVLVRRYFPPLEVGLYAALSTLGKIIFFSISALMTAAFPIIAETYEKKRSIHKLVLLTILGSLALAVIPVSLYFLYPTFFVRLLYGNDYLAISPLLGIMGILAAIYSINFVLTMILLAKKLTQVWLISILLASLHTGLLIRFHSGLFTVIMMGVLTNCLLLTLLILYYSSDNKIVRTLYAKVSNSK